MKVTFLDESGDHSLTKIDDQFPIFGLAGCVFDENDYDQNSKAKIDALKLKYFNNTDVILHSREIRKCEPPFNILLNPHTKLNFYTDLNNLLRGLDFAIFASVILKKQLKDHTTDPANPYTLSMRYMLEQFLLYLEQHDDIGYISAEARDPKSNTDLLTTFTDVLNNGIRDGKEKDIKAERFQTRIQKMVFVTKQQNQNGHQIADLVAYPITKYGWNKANPNPAFEVIQQKIDGLQILPN